MRRGRLYTPAWRSPNEPDRKVAVKTANELTGNEAGTLLPRRDGKVVPVSVHFEDNGLCTDDDDDDKDDERLVAATSEDQGDAARQPMAESDCAERRESVPFSSSSSSSMSGELRAYDDSNLKSSVYDLPSELDGSTSSALPTRPGTDSTTGLRQSRVEALARSAVSAVVKSCRSPQCSRRDVDTDVVDCSSSVSSPAVFVVSDTKQLVIFTVDRQLRCTAVSPVLRAPRLSCSDQTLNR